MDLPIVHPTAIRFYLEKIGINPRDEHSVVLGYGCLRLLEHVVKSRVWRYPHAAYQNERNHRVLSELFSEIVPVIDLLFESPDFWAIFNNTYEHAIKLSFPDFIRNVCPNFVADPDECVRLLEGDEFGTGAVSPDIARSLHTVVIFLCRDTDTFEQAYMDYLRFFTLAGIDPLQRNLFFELFTVVNGYSLSSGPKIRTSSNAVRAISFFSSLSLPINFQIDLYASIREHITKGIDNPFAYLSKRATEYNSYLFESMARFEAEFNKCAELLRTVKPSEFLETLIAEETLWKKYGALTTEDVVYVISDKERLPAKLKKRRGAVPDAVTECAFVYSRFKNYMSATQGMQKVLIVNPSIPFIRQWVTSKALAGIETHFMMHWESSAIILSQEFSRFPHCRFFAPKDFSGSTLEGYDSYLLFHRDYIDNASQMEFVVSLISVIGADRVFCLFPDEQTKELVKQLSAREYFRCNPYLDAVDILPTKVFTSESKRKVFLRIMQSKEDTSLSVAIHMKAYRLAEDAALRKEFPALTKVLIPLEKNVQTTLSTLAGPSSIRTVYQNEGRSSRPDRQRNLPRSYVFSPELTVWYTLNFPKDEDVLTPKVKAYLCKYPTERKMKYGELKRGEEIKMAHVWKTNFPEEAIKSWIEDTAVFAPKVYKEAVSLIRDQYKRGPISLKTFWYLHYQKTAQSVLTKQGFVQKLFIRSPEAAKLIIGESLKEDYANAVNRFFDARFPNEGYEEDKKAADRDEYIHYVWDFLCDLLDTAVEESYYKTNPVEELCSRVRSRHDEFSELRDALTKKTFTLEEEKALLNMALEDDGPLALGAMIRLFTGMSPAQVCALQYRDFEAIPRTGEYQFLVYKKIAKAGDSPTPLKRDEEYRRIPIVPLLAERICKYKQRIESTFGVNLKDSYIVSGDFLGDKPAEVSRPYAPSTLQKYCKKMIADLGIEHVSLLIPEEDGETKESDFSQYQSDIFRSHLRYRLKNTCGFTNSECDYVLGVKQKNTFAKHYCDYTSPFAQIAMITKLSWWTMLLQPAGGCPTRKALSLRNAHLSVSPINIGCAAAELSLSVSPLTSDAAAEVRLCFESECGCDGTINMFKEENDRE